MLRTPTVDQAPCRMPRTTGDAPVTRRGVQGATVWASPAGLLPVLGDGRVGLCRAVKRDHVVLQHWLWLHRQVDKWGVCREKRCPCRWGAAFTVWGLNPQENMRVKASDSTTRDPQSSHSPGGPQKVGGLGRGLPPSLEVPDFRPSGGGVRAPAVDSRPVFKRTVSREAGLPGPQSVLSTFQLWENKPLQKGEVGRGGAEARGGCGH